MTHFDRDRHTYVADLADVVASWPPVSCVLPFHIRDVELDVEAERVALYRAASGENAARVMVACLAGECFTGGHRILRDWLTHGAPDVGTLAKWICSISQPARDDIAEALYPVDLADEWLAISIPELEARLTAARLIRYQAAQAREHGAVEVTHGR